MKEEIRALSEVVKEKENYIMCKESSGAWQASNGTDAGRRGKGSFSGTSKGTAARLGGGHGVQQLLEQIRTLERSLQLAKKQQQEKDNKLDVAEANKNALQVCYIVLTVYIHNIILETKHHIKYIFFHTGEHRPFGEGKREVEVRIEEYVLT